MKIICIGLNYVKHVAEFSRAKPEKPVFFMKPDTALLRNNQPFFYPDFSSNVHHEVELVLKIGKVGRSIPERFALRYIESVGLGVDFTARDLQEQCRQRGLPWEMAKSFDFSAPVSREFIPVAEIPDLNSINFSLDINGATVQQGCSSDLIFSFAEIISYVSQFLTLKTGDLIYTGTPENVGPVNINDNLKGYIDNRIMFDFNIK
jgi:2-keto-4-pentenoate hydratase/2-oxohepta-3-ene-1,7-dioic acid hydratase in catechol pathway